MDQFIDLPQEGSNLFKFFNVQLFHSKLKTNYLGRNFIYKFLTTSTMDDSSKEAETSPSGTLILAEKQSKGKGRVNRTWSSSFLGNLYFTFFFKLKDPQTSLKFHFACPVAIAVSLENLGIKNVGIKWPNDVWIKNKKICGIMINCDYMNYATIHCGIGVNFFENMLKNEFEDLQKISTSVYNELNHNNAQRETFLADFCNNFENLIFDSYENILKKYQKYDILINKKVTVMPKKKEDKESYYEAQAIGYTSNGELIVKNKDGKVIELMSEEVSIRPEDF